MTDTTRYEIDTILAGIIQVRQDVAELRAMMKVLWVILCPEMPAPVEGDIEIMDS